MSKKRYRNVSPLSTDDHQGYKRLDPSYRHVYGDYVCGAIHSNAIEGYRES
ncbi:MAG: hypothetical protein AB7P69_29160 [Candidatus Binatia bacterium]